MSSELITGIGELTTCDDEGAVLTDAAVVLEDGLVRWVGPRAAVPAADTATDVDGRAVLPGWVDSHSHLVFAGDRTAEFEARMAGRPYSAGGIGVTTTATRAADDAELARGLRARLEEALCQGTTTTEVKTGYGLTVRDELRLARLAAVEVEDVTYLGAHLVPDGVDPEHYLSLVTGEMLTAVRPHTRWADVFCEPRGAFDEPASRQVLVAAREAGLGLRVHANQLGPGPGVALAVELGAASADHCNHLDDADVDALAGCWSDAPRAGAPGAAGAAAGGAGTVATLLPASDLCTRQPLAPARRLLDAGAVVALAANANPGSSNTTSMAFCVATAVLQMGMTVTEALWAATRGGALALGRDRGPGAVGSLAVGHRADLQVLDAPSATHLAYRPGVPLTWRVYRRGVLAASVERRATPVVPAGRR